MEQLKGCEETCPLQAPGRWNNMHRHKKTFNNPLLTLQRAPSLRFGRVLPEESMPLSKPNLEFFSPSRTTIGAITIFCKRHLALSQNFLLCASANAGSETLTQLNEHELTFYLITSPSPFIIQQCARGVGKEPIKPNQTNHHHPLAQQNCHQKLQKTGFSSLPPPLRSSSFVIR